MKRFHRKDHAKSSIYAKRESQTGPKTFFCFMCIWISHLTTRNTNTDHAVRTKCRLMRKLYTINSQEMASIWGKVRGLKNITASKSHNFQCTDQMSRLLIIRVSYRKTQNIYCDI